MASLALQWPLDVLTQHCAAAQALNNERTIQHNAAAGSPLEAIVNYVVQSHHRTSVVRPIICRQPLAHECLCASRMCKWLSHLLHTPQDKNSTQ
jgi:hypothetical protein